MPPLPHLKPQAKQTLDDLLHSTVSSHQTPAVFLGATNEREEVYWGCEGEKEFGEGGEEVTEDTGESWRVEGSSFFLFGRPKLIVICAWVDGVIWG